MSEQTVNDLNATETVVEDQPLPTEGQKTYTEDEVQRLLSAVKKTRDEAKTLSKESKERLMQMEKFKEINPDEYRKLQEDAALAEKERRAVEERSSLLEEKYGAQTAEAVKAMEMKEAELTEFRKRYVLEKVFFAAGGRTDADGGASFFDLIADKVGHRFRLDGSGQVIVVDEQGDPMIDKETGKRLDPETFMASFKTHKIYGTFFKSQKGSGAGLPYGSDSSALPGEDMDSMTPDELFFKGWA